MSVTASSGSPRVSPQLYDTLPLSSVRQAEQQDRFPDNGELDTLITFFQSGRSRVEAAARLTANADAIVARAANRIFVGGTPLSYLDGPLVDTSTGRDGGVLASDQKAFASSVETFVQGNEGGGLFGRILGGFQEAADVRVVIPSGFTPINVSRYGTARMRKSVRDLGWFLRYVGYAVVAGDPSILRVNTRGLRDILEKGCSLPATNLALQEMRAAAAALFEAGSEARSLVIASFNVLLEELAVATPSTRARLGSPEQQGLQLPAIYALSAEGAQRFVMKPGLSGGQKAEVVRAAYRQVFERDIAKAYSQAPCPVEATQLRQGQISMREFIRALGRSKEYKKQFYSRFSNSRAVELAFRHFLGRGVSSIEEFRRYFAIVSAQGLNGLVDSLINTLEYGRVFGEETVPYLRDLGEEAQESAGWGSHRKLFNYSAPFDGVPQYITLYAGYRRPLPDQHAYGGGNDPLGIQYGAIFPSATASVRTRPAPHGYQTRRILVGNGMKAPGQMNSPGFRSSQPRRVGPKVVRLDQIATGGASVPRRSGQPSVRNSESSTQAVLNAVYVQVLGTGGYAGDRLTVEEIKLENGDINLREFVRQVARSKAFRRRYWSNLYLTKAIEVMHRRLLGRPTFGRFEINAYFDIAARKGFYGVVNAMIDSDEYSQAFGENTVPYERFITSADLNSRRVPGLKPALDTAAIAEPGGLKRPDVAREQTLFTPGNLTQRNLSQPRVVRGNWSAAISGQVAGEPTQAVNLDNDNSVRSLPEPTRLWSAPRWQPSPGGVATPNRISRVPAARISAAPSSAAPAAPGSWSSSRSTGVGLGLAETATSAMEKALKGSNPAKGLSRRGSLAQPIRLADQASDTEFEAVISATYRQLLNRDLFAAERLGDAESQLRAGNLSVADFVAQVALSELFQNRLRRMAPLRAATAAHMALLGRAPEAAEASRFLATRTSKGQQQAVQDLLSSPSYASRFGQDTVPNLGGLLTQPGVPLSSYNRAAGLYGGNAAMNPPIKGAI
ncbi:MAG: phycobilisome rod-core linker polypeptide [Synechococcus sp.]|nr:phycobilisome rod-core linker polypeptide [Synechococcus sp.]